MGAHNHSMRILFPQDGSESCLFLTADADPLFFNAVLDPSLSNLNAKNKQLIFSLLPVLTGTGTGYLNFTASITNIEPRLRAGGIQEPGNSQKGLGSATGKFNHF